LGKDVYLKAPDNEALTGNVTLYNLWGQQVYQTRLNGTKQQTLHTTLITGMYVVQLKSDNNVLLAKKVVIR